MPVSSTPPARSAAPAGAPPTATPEGFDELLLRGDVRAVYQPIVDLDTRAVVGWEALARGPERTPFAFPDHLFGFARTFGRLADLDFRCRAAAFDGAVAAGLRDAQELFVNIEPETAGTPRPQFLLDAAARAQAAGLRVTVEITERAVTARPAELIAQVARYRELGWGVALDDVGVDPRSVSLMPLVRPDVIKLDMSFVQEPMTRDRARVVHAVVAEAERSGAKVLAEGIETEEQALLARTLGADLGQGWLFGRPGRLRPASGGKGTGRVRARGRDTLGTPFEHLSSARALRRGTKRQLLEMSLALEDEALVQGSSAVILSTFQDARYFPASTRARYGELAERLALVGALAHDLGHEPAPGVRGGALDSDEVLRGEWDVIVLGPHFAGAFTARDLGDTGADGERRFDYVLTHDRELVIAAAARLVGRVAPELP